MNIHYLTLEKDSPAVLTRVVWAVGTGAALVVFVLLLWQGVLRGEMMMENRKCVYAERERNAAYMARDNAIRACNEQVARAASAQTDAENKLMLATAAKSKAEAQCAEDEREMQILRETVARSGRSMRAY
jgi:hypothetical protein